MSTRKKGIRKASPLAVMMKFDQLFMQHKPSWVISLLGCTPTIKVNSHCYFQESLDLQKQSAIYNLQCLAQRWERLLFTTGGVLNLHKSCGTLMSWKWKAGEAYLEALTPSSPPLLLTA